MTKVFVILFSVLMRWLRNFEKNYSYHLAMVYKHNPILTAIKFFYELALKPWTILFKENLVL